MTDCDAMTSAMTSAVTDVSEWRDVTVRWDEAAALRSKASAPSSTSPRSTPSAPCKPGLFSVCYFTALEVSIMQSVEFIRLSVCYHFKFRITDL